MLKKFVILFSCLVATFVVVVMQQPSEFKISRTTVIDASAQDIFDRVDNLRSWQNWSPWAKLDPNATVSYSGPESGVGAASSWAGNSEVGVGSMRITESRPVGLIKMQLDFKKPFAATNEAQFDFATTIGGTKVTWTMSGKNGFIAKAMSLFMDCDKMVGEKFEEGLKSLGKLVAVPGNT